jgi:hypothetical protein
MAKVVYTVSSTRLLIGGASYGWFTNLLIYWLLLGKPRSPIGWVPCTIVSYWSFDKRTLAQGDAVKIPPKSEKDEDDIEG